ncbi:Holliday junction resolvase RuvX [Synechococcales cyanobacterium C]|uniref:Holliday junction resolvase RuvX n=2 Tax=Petrachloros TaxID=2918834 RepID=A0A8K2A9P9_9CYAN|nr:Holliday junction resolvase RuvX [Petrachloros mirabilis ULC683]
MTVVVKSKLASSSEAPDSDPVIVVGFDPGRDKCGLAVMDTDRKLYYHQVILADAVSTTLEEVNQAYDISVLVMGNQTTAQHWQAQVAAVLPSQVPIRQVDERFSTLEARDRYWQMYPPKGLMRWVPQSLRTIPRPLDDIAAIILIERYLTIRNP